MKPGNKVFHVYYSNWKKAYPVTVSFRHYTANNTLAVVLIDAGTNVINSIFATITVNIPGVFEDYQDETHAYIDTNNCPWAENFLQENGIAKPWKNFKGKSGYCEYPLYEFDLNSIYASEEK